MGNSQTRAKNKLIANRVRDLIQVPLVLVAQYDNGPFVDKDQKVVEQPEPGDFPVWMDVSIIPGESFHAEMGTTGRHRNPHTVAIGLNSGLGAGTNATDDIVDSIKTAFRSTVADGIIYQTPTVLREGRAEDGAWWRTTVLIPTFYDD